MHNTATAASVGYLNDGTTRLAAGVAMRQHSQVGIKGGFLVLPILSTLPECSAGLPNEGNRWYQTPGAEISLLYVSCFLCWLANFSHAQNQLPPFRGGGVGVVWRTSDRGGLTGDHICYVWCSRLICNCSPWACVGNQMLGIHGGSKQTVPDHCRLVQYARGATLLPLPLARVCHRRASLMELTVLPDCPGPHPRGVSATRAGSGFTSPGVRNVLLCFFPHRQQIITEQMEFCQQAPHCLSSWSLNVFRQ